jgi:hypothetical protein
LLDVYGAVLTAFSGRPLDRSASGERYVCLGYRLLQTGDATSWSDDSNAVVYRKTRDALLFSPKAITRMEETLGLLHILPRWPRHCEVH